MKKTNLSIISIIITIISLFLFSGNVFSQFANWHLDTTNSSIYYNSGNVGIGVISPTVKLDINGDLRLRGNSITLPTNGNINFGSYGNGSLSFNLFLGGEGDLNGGSKPIMTLYPNGWFGLGSAQTGDAPLTVFAQTTPAYPYIQPMATFMEIDSGENTIAELDIITRNGEDGYNNIAKENDFSIIWSDFGGLYASNLSSGLVIAPRQPWGDPNISPSGIRIDGTGKVGIGIKDPKSSLDVAGDVRINYKDLFLANNYTNDGIGWYGLSKTFASKDIGGPIVYGSNGGALGIRNGQNESVALNWMPDSIYNTLVIVDGNLRSTKNFVGDNYTSSSIMNLKTLNQTRLIIDSTGYIGIGDVTPFTKFQVSVSDTNKAFSVYRSDLSRDVYRVTGNGKVYAYEVNVLVTTDFPDYVFAKDYKLMSLAQLENYINIHSHLPDVPSQTEVAEKGVNVGDMQTILLKKIEEISLYLIELKKQNDELKKENDALKNRVDIIENSKK